MIEFPSVQKSVIQNHYDVSTLFYRLLWGKHIHHGYWEGVEKSQVAQQKLTERLAALSKVKRDSRVIDIGCGMGGSSCWLASELGCRVSGVTLSPVQRWWAATESRLRGIKPRPEFLCHDAESIDFPVGQADLVWSIECTEHLFDKPAFFKRAATWLKSGGRFALCAWLAGEPPMSNEKIELVKKVCEGMFCPSLGTQTDYCSWFEESGLKIVDTGIWTRQVEQTWEICKRRVDRYGMRYLARVLGKNHTLFLDHFESILNAYKSGAMEYGYFIAEKVSG